MQREEKKLTSSEISDGKIIRSQSKSRHKRLIGFILGPIVSGILHVVIIAIMAYTITDKRAETKAEIEIDFAPAEKDLIMEPLLPEPVIDDAPVPVDVDPSDTSPVIHDDAPEQTDVPEDEQLDTPPSLDDDFDIDISGPPSAFTLPTSHSIRSKGDRKKALESGQGSKRGQAALLSALSWMKQVQNPDGSWGSKAESRAAITGLALLTYLAHGELPTSKLYGLNVKKAIKWLVNSDTNLRGAHAYPHAIKAYALAEAYAMTGNSSIVPALRQAMTIIVEGQQENGSFDYSYKKGTRLDLSFAGWNYQAMKACYETDIEIPGLENGIRQGIKWLKLSAAQNNSFPYAIDGNKVSGGGKASMRAVGVLSLQIFSEGHTAAIRDELKRISKSDLKEFNWDKAPASSLYSWYYATQAMFQAGKKYWKPWNRVFQKELINNQHKDGYWVYPGNGHESSAGDETSQRIYATSLCSLMLTVYYRYLPSHNVREGFEAKVRKRRKRLAAEVQEDETEIFQFLLD